MLPPDQPVRVAQRLIHRTIGDEVFVLMFDSRMHWLKNPTAKHLWDLLIAAGPAGLTPRAAAATLVAEYDVTPDVALADTVEFFANLLGKGLVDSKTPEA